MVRNRVLLTILFTLTLICLLLVWHRQEICHKLVSFDKSTLICPIRTKSRPCIDSVEVLPRPRPLVIISAGGHGSASTFLFNALRILMRIRDPNTISGWYEDLERFYQQYGRTIDREHKHTEGSANEVKLRGNRMLALKSVGSVLIKIHQVQEWHEFLGYPDGYAKMDGIVNGVFTSHRDVRQVIRFIRAMGWGTVHTEKQRSHSDFCRRKRKVEKGGILVDLDQPRFLRDEEYEDVENWVQMARGHLVCRQVLIDTAGQALKMDIKAEDVKKLSFEDTIEFLRKLGSHLDYIFTQNDLHSAATELRMLKPVKCDSGYDVELDVHPVTQYHKGHWHGSESGDDERGMEAIAKDDICRRWLKAHEYL